MYEKITNTVGTILVYVASIGLLGGQNTYARGVDDRSREVTNEISNKSGGCIRTPLEDLINKSKPNKQTISCSPMQDDYNHECRLCRPGGKKKPERSEFPNVHHGVIDRVKIGLGRIQYRVEGDDDGKLIACPCGSGNHPYEICNC